MFLNIYIYIKSAIKNCPHHFELTQILKFIRRGTSLEWPLKCTMKNVYYRIDTPHGILNGVYSRGQLEIYKENFMSVDDVPTEFENVTKNQELSGKRLFQM